MDVPPPAGESATTAITNHMVCLAREGGVEHICFLLVLRAAETHLPKTFKDVANLPADCKDLSAKRLKVPLDVKVDKENSLKSSFIWSIYLYTILLVCALLSRTFM